MKIDPVTKRTLRQVAVAILVFGVALAISSVLDAFEVTREFGRDNKLLTAIIPVITLVVSVIIVIGFIAWVKWLVLHKGRRRAKSGKDTGSIDSRFD